MKALVTVGCSSAVTFSFFFAALMLENSATIVLVSLKDETFFNIVKGSNPDD
jgi:hypothetical protein